MRPARRGSLAALVALLAPAWVLVLARALPALCATPVAPDVLALAAVAAGWTFPCGSAVTFAVLAGLLADVPSEGPVGLLAARLGVLALVTARLRARTGLEGALLPTCVALAGTLVERALAAVTIALLHPDVSLEALLARSAWIALCTAAVAPLGVGAARALAPEAS